MLRGISVLQTSIFRYWFSLLCRFCFNEVSYFYFILDYIPLLWGQKCCDGLPLNDDCLPLLQTEQLTPCTEKSIQEQLLNETVCIE